MKIDIYNDSISYVTDEVSTVPTAEANLNEANRIKFVTDLAAVSRGKDSSSNPAIRYKALLKEAAPTNPITQPTLFDKQVKSPSRPLEFLPIILGYKTIDDIIRVSKIDGTPLDAQNGVHLEIYLSEFNNSLGKYSFLKDGCIYTNMRACLNTGISYNSIPYATPKDLVLYKNFKAIRAKIPMFVFNHFVTHTALSKETLSDRVTLQSGEYWLPEDFKQRIDNKLKNVKEVDTNIINLDAISLAMDDKDELLDVLLTLDQKSIQKLFKSLNYKPEIYQRVMLEFRYKTTVATGWYNDPHTWKHFLIEREAYPGIHKSWVQPETKQFALAIKQLFGV